MSEWQPIETAPTKPFDPEKWFMEHSERMLVCRPGGYTTIASYNFTERGKGRWMDHTNRVTMPTLWQPLPPPPND